MPDFTDRDALYAAAINRAADYGLGPHPLPESYVLAARAGVDAVLAALRIENVTPLIVRPDDGPCPRCGTLPLLDVHVCQSLSFSERMRAGATGRSDRERAWDGGMDGGRLG